MGGSASTHRADAQGVRRVQSFRSQVVRDRDLDTSWNRPSALADPQRLSFTKRLTLSLGTVTQRVTRISAIGTPTECDWTRAETWGVSDIRNTDAKWARAADAEARLPLHNLAACASDERVLRVLLQRYPAAARVRDGAGMSPLHHAARAGQSVQIVLLLLRACPDMLLARCHSGSCPLHCAAEAPRGAAEALAVVHVLVNACPDALLCRDDRGCLPLHRAAAQSDAPGVVQLLLDAYPAAAGAPNDIGDLPVHLAASSSKLPETLQLLLPGQHLKRNNFGCCPLHLAAWRNTAKGAGVVRSMLELPGGAEAAEAADHFGMLPLHYAACRAGGGDTLCLVASAHARGVAHRSNHGRVPFEMADPHSSCYHALKKAHEAGQWREADREILTAPSTPRQQPGGLQKGRVSFSVGTGTAPSSRRTSRGGAQTAVPRRTSAGDTSSRNNANRTPIDELIEQLEL